MESSRFRVKHCFPCPKAMKSVRARAMAIAAVTEVAAAEAMATAEMAVVIAAAVATGVAAENAAMAVAAGMAADGEDKIEINVLAPLLEGLFFDTCNCPQNLIFLRSWSLASLPSVRLPR